MTGRLPHLCHVFPSFAPGGPEMRTVTIMNALRASVRHTVIPLDGRADAASAVSAGVTIDVRQPPAGKGRYTYARALAPVLEAIAPDLLLTYNWAGVDGVVAAIGLPVPVIHGEDGFGPEEAERLKWRRVLTRRLALRRADAVVVPSHTLEAIARRRYGVPDARLKRISNGVDTDRFHPRRDVAWRRVQGIADSDVVFGYVGALRAEKQLDVLIRCVAALQRADVWLVLVGDGP